MVELFSDFAGTHRLARFNGPVGKKWPTADILVPGRSILLTLSTVTDYVNNPASDRFGLRAVVTGHASYPVALQPVQRLLDAASLALG